MKKLLLLIAILIFANQMTFSACWICVRYSYTNYEWRCRLIGGECRELPKPNPQTGYCRDIKALSTNQPPIINVDKEGRATFEQNGQISEIGSDILEDYIKNTKTINQAELERLIKNDAGKVSKERLNKLAKEFNATIVSVNKLPKANYCPPCEEELKNTTSTTAKQTPNTSFGEKTNQSKPMDHGVLSIGAGMSSSSSAMKTNANIGNLTNFNVGAYVPIFSYGGATGGVIGKTIGINAGAEYFSSNKDYNLSNYNSYNITGQTNTPNVVAKGTGSPKAQGFKFEAGAQANFTFGDVTISPILNGAYFNLKQKAFNITQNSTVNGQSRAYSLYNQAETKTNGFAFIPKLRLSYFLGKLGFYVEGNYTIGPTIKTEVSTFKPNGTANAQGNYNIDQMLIGTDLALTKSTKYNAIGINAGLGLTIGGDKSAARLKGKVIRMGDKGIVRGKRYFTDNQIIINDTGSTNPMHESDLNYEEDYSVKDVKTLSFLNTSDLVIRKGKYPADYSQNPFGTITLMLASPISAKSISEKGLKRISSSGYHCDKDCKEEKDVCWNCNGSKPKALYYYFTLEPFIENGMITRLLLINNKVTLDGKNLTPDDLAARRRIEVLKSNKTSNPLAKEAAPKKVKCACGKDIYGKDEATCRRICQFLKDGTYINGKVSFTPAELEGIKKDYLDGLMVDNNGTKELNPQLFKLATQPSDLAEQKVSIKKAGKTYAFLGNQDELVKIISIPSARAQECTDCKETDNCENSGHFDCCCNGGYCWCLICIIKSTMSELPDDKVVATGDGGTGSQPTTAQSTIPHIGLKRWWRHNNGDTNSCTGKGIYCFRRKFMDEAEIKSFAPETDEVLSETTISLKGNLILIKTIGIKGSLSANTIQAFKDKKVESLGSYISPDVLEPLFKDINLKTPEKGITIQPKEQSYLVNETRFEGKNVSIVEALEKTKINIEGKSYNLVIITTSGRGTGSPKQAGF